MDGKEATATKGRTNRSLAIALVLAVLAALTTRARFANEAENRAPPLEVLSRPRLCAGIALDGEPLGLAFGESWEELAAAAVTDLGLPAACAPLVRGARDQGARLAFAAGGKGGCRGIGEELLPAPARLLCGAGLEVNRDSARDLESLPGVGPVRSRALVESRERDGHFTSRDDLQRVRGIGPATAERIAPWLEDIE